MGTREDTGGAGRDRALHYLVVFISLLAALAVVFRADLFSGSSLFFKAFRDINPFIAQYPWSRLALASFEQGLFPLWNPYNLLGLPHLANYQSAALSPFLWPQVFFPLELIAVPYLVSRLAMAGVGAYWFSRRIALSRAGAFAAAAAFSLSGFMVQYVNDQHIVIDMLLPWLLGAGHGLATTRRGRDFLFTVALSALVLLGGQPGSAIFTLAAGYSYAFYLALFTRPRGGGVLLVAAAGSCSVLAAMPQLLPFIEYLPRAWTFHTPSFGAEHLMPAGLLTFIAPGFYGPLDHSRLILPLIRTAPYMGASVAVLATAAAMRPAGRHTAFFAAAALASLAMLAGLPPLSLLTRLPLLGSLTFIKYLQPLLTFSAALLAGTYISEAGRGGGPLRLIGPALVVVCAATLARIIEPVPAADPAFMNGGLVTAASFAVACVLVRGASLSGRGSRAGVVLAGLVLVELVASSCVNRPFMHWNAAREDFRWLRDLTTGENLPRVSAHEDVYLPNMNLVGPGYEAGTADALIIEESADLFRKASGRTPLEFHESFLAYHSLRELPRGPLSGLMGVKYELSRKALPRNEAMEKIGKLMRITAPSPRHVSVTRVAIKDELKTALFEHPPARIEVPRGSLPARPGKPYASFSIGFDPEAARLEGDGAWFLAFPGPGSISFARYMDPRRADEAGWKKARTSSQPGFLVTLPGKSADHDWALWGDLRTATEEMPPGRVINGVKLYENPRAAARAYVAELTIEAADDTLEATEEAAGSFENFAVLKKGEASAGGGRGKVDRLEHGLQSVSMQVRCAGPCLVVLADSYYPGWKAYVNGVESRILRVNHAMRGVEAPGGESDVTFIYEPASFGLGLWCGVVTSAVLALVLICSRGRLSE